MTTTHLPTRKPPSSLVEALSVTMKWSLGLVEPLLPLAERNALDADLRHVFATWPDAAAGLTGGICSDMVCTLPIHDPWRSMSATIDGPVTMTRGAHAPESTGAVLPDGTPFDGVRAIADRVEPLFTDPDLDTAIVALSVPPPAEVGALLAFAADGWRVAAEAARAVHTAAATSHPDGSSDHFYDVCTTAITWAVHRRRSYHLTIDTWPVESAWSWSYREAWNAKGEPWDETAIDIALAQELIVDDESAAP